MGAKKWGQKNGSQKVGPKSWDKKVGAEKLGPKKLGSKSWTQKVEVKNLEPKICYKSCGQKVGIQSFIHSGGQDSKVKVQKVMST